MHLLGDIKIICNNLCEVISARVFFSPQRLRWIVVFTLFAVTDLCGSCATPTATPVSKGTPRSAKTETDLNSDSGPWLFRQTDNAATLIGYILVFGASCFAYKQWVAEQKWKRKETLMDLIAAFEDTPGSRNAMMMFTKVERDVALFDKDRREDCYVPVAPGEIARALIPDHFLERTYDPKQDAIRDSFDDFLGRLSRIATYRKDGLFQDVDVESVIEAWGRRIDSLPDECKLHRNFKLFVHWRGMKNVQELFEKSALGKHIPEGETELQKEIRDGDWKLHGKYYV